LLISLAIYFFIIPKVGLSFLPFCDQGEVRIKFEFPTSYNLETTEKLLKEAAARLGFDKEIFDNADEKKPSILRSIISLNYGATYADYSVGSLNREKIYMAQSDAIRPDRPMIKNISKPRRVSSDIRRSFFIIF
jgi:hypothetical protein